MASRSSKRVLKSFRLEGTGVVLSRGDCVVIRTLYDKDQDESLNIAKIEKIDVFQNTEEVRMTVRWYYFPEKTHIGRQSWHSSREIFLSDHYDTVSAESVEGKCSVHMIQDCQYSKLDSMNDEDYFCRFRYLVLKERFVPEKVQTHCKCDLPNNPDLFMVMCEWCRDWFHPNCLHLTQEQVENLEHFFCVRCCRKLAQEGVQSVLPLRGLYDRDIA